MQKIYEALNFSVNGQYVDGLIKYTSDISNLPQRTNRALKEIKPNYIFITNNKPTILFFDKNVKRKKVFKQCWNFSEAPIIIIENDTDFDIYNGFDYIRKNKDKEFLLKEVEDKSKINYISIISGEYFAKSKDFSANNINKVDKKLLENIKYARDKLLSLNLSSHVGIANSLLGRVIFIRYLIDREVLLKFEDKHKALTNSEFKEILLSKERTYKLFKYLKSDDGFNGDWFPIEESEEDLVNEEHLEVLKQLISGTDLKTNQGSLFDIYDFSIIPIEFISNVYESFIGEENQKKDGAYYTPTFLVDYILKYTIDDFFEKNPNEYNCKVLDPACGSGIFLVETLRKLIAQYEKVKNRKIKAEEIVQLVKDNIFGIDKNENALKISVFSLYLTMLDYQSPTDIEKFKFPYLLDSEKNEDKPNFFHSDFFDTEADFNTILQEKELDFIIGNPPYGKSTIKEDSLVDKYIKDNHVKVGNGNIVQSFMIRVKDLVSKNTTISFIVTSKVLYNLHSKDFRTYFLNNFKINHILELSSVRKDVFIKAKVPVAIFFYNHCIDKKEILENKINYISMKPSPYFEKLKILFISKSDFKKVQQSKVLEYDYLWKILVYGSYLDFNLIKKLKSNQYTTIQQLINSGKLIKYQGFKRKDGDKKIDVHKLKNFYFIDTSSKRKDLKPFYISKKLEKFKHDYVGYINRKLYNDYSDLFKAPILLFTGGLTNQLKQNSGISYENATFTSSVVALKSINNNIKILKTINGLFYSDYFSYYLLHTGSSTGVKQEESDDHEKLNLPYIESSKIINVVSKIENLQKQYYDENSSVLFEYQDKLNMLFSKLNHYIFQTLKLSKQEYSLIDYSNNIIIPWIIQKKYDKAFEKLKYKDKRIDNYLNIFTEHYTKIYAQINKYFSVKVYWDKYAIGIYFKVLDEEQKEQIEWVKEPNIQNFLKISSGKTLENLFIQKDIKGFETNGFYVIKPNEYKNWHEAIGYLDFYEFEDAILRAGKTNFLSKESKNV